MSRAGSSGAQNSESRSRKSFLPAALTVCKRRFQIKIPEIACRLFVWSCIGASSFSSYGLYVLGSANNSQQKPVGALKSVFTSELIKLVDLKSQNLVLESLDTNQYFFETNIVPKNNLKFAELANTAITRIYPNYKFDRIAYVTNEDGYVITNKSFPIFDENKVAKALPKHGYVEGEIDCGLGFRLAMEATGLYVRNSDGSTVDVAKGYRNVLPKNGWMRVAQAKSGSMFSVASVRRNVEKFFGDMNRPIAVVMTNNNDPSAAGHVFYVDANDKTYSGFIQENKSTGVKDEANYSWIAFAYTGPVVNYKTREIVEVAYAEPKRHAGGFHKHYRHGHNMYAENVNYAHGVN